MHYKIAVAKLTVRHSRWLSILRITLTDVSSVDFLHIFPNPSMSTESVINQEPAPESQVQQSVPKSVAAQPIVYVNKDGKPITFDEYRVLLTQFTYVDSNWRVNGLGQRERRPKI